MSMQPDAYVHGYAEAESERLKAQASSVLECLHADVRYGARERVLEVACGTGAQTITLARNNPHVRIVAFDRSRQSLDQARARVADAGITNVEFHQLDIFSLPFERESFDHIFVCFVLEHLPDPDRALVVLQKFLKPGGGIIVFEGDHGSTFFYPESSWADKAIACQVKLQQRAGGNAMIGRRLYPMLKQAGFADVRVSPCMIYVDGSRPDLSDRMTRRTFAAMIAGVREDAIAAGLIDAAFFDRGIQDLHRTAAEDGVFCYTFFKATAKVNG